jgi:4-hydroxybenzoate polyprenyltransferase
MKRKLTFIIERANIVPNILLCSFILLSLNLLLKGVINFPASLLGFLSLFTFIIELRLMDEYKDYEKDKIANPTRPLPRGLISLPECLGMIYLFLGALWIFALSAALLFNWKAGLFQALVNIWLYLMYKEFFVGKNLSNHPLTYATTHQIIIVPILFFIVALIDPTQIFSHITFGLSFILLGSFYTYEVGRKLNPNADKILKTYLVEYGPEKTVLILSFLVLLPLYGAFLLNSLLWELIPSIILYANLSLIILKPNNYKKVEGLIGLYLLYNMIWPAIRFAMIK